MHQRWVVCFAVAGDLRFGSHHDMMRAIERWVVRADLPLAYSQGFNPRPKLSVVCPRPVGVASRADLLTLTLTEAIDAEQLCGRLRRARPPEGLGVVGARPVEGKRSPQCEWVRCEMPIAPAAQGRLAERIEQLLGQREWPIERQMVSKRRGAGASVKTVDLRPFVADLSLAAGRLTWTQRFLDQQSARPREVVALLATADGGDGAAITRTAAGYRIENDIIEGPKAFVTEPTKP